MRKVSILKKNLAILNLYARNHRTPKYETEVDKIKEELDKFSVIM